MIITELLNKYFYQFDYIILESVHNFAENGGMIFRYVFKFIELFGSKAIGFIFLSIILFFIRKNKKDAYMMFISIVLIFVLNDLIIKNVVQRPRPYMTDISDYTIWWQYAGSHMKNSFSFMSGHTALSVACSLCYFFSYKKYRFLLISIVITILFALSRLFFVVHYPSDCLFAIIFSIPIAYLSYLITTKLEDKLDFILKKIMPFAFKL